MLYLAYQSYKKSLKHYVRALRIDMLCFIIGNNVNLGCIFLMDVNPTELPLQVAVEMTNINVFNSLQTACRDWIVGFNNMNVEIQN